jgi:hypothetical protein
MPNETFPELSGIDDIPIDKIWRKYILAFGGN